MLSKKINQPSIVIGLRSDFEDMLEYNNDIVRKFLAILQEENSGDFVLVTNLQTNDNSTGRSLLYEFCFKT